MPGDPEKLGGYWLAGRIGAGRHGVVYDAYDDAGRRFAVRVPRGPLPRLRPVTHPHLAGVVDVRPGGPFPYVVSEYACGTSLREAVALRGPYAGEQLVALATAVASALSCLHAAGLTHGDLRPGKVLLTGDGPKVVCPGGPGAVGCARTYLAPEVVTGTRPGAAGDVFAWGALVLFAATGEDPFRGGSMGEVMHRLLSCDPDVTVLPCRLRDPVARALSKDPASRPGAAGLLIPTPARVPPLPGPPALGEVAEELYASLTAGDRARLRDLLVELDSGTAPVVGHGPVEPVISRLLESGLLVRPGVAVPPTRAEAGTLVAVTGDRLAPASRALFHAWPRLRGWLDQPREETRSWAPACLPPFRPRRPGLRWPSAAAVAAAALAASVALRDARRTAERLGAAFSRPRSPFRPHARP
ncbi:protein kinase domain-containing protein [Nonomuraea sp. CA-218870]|uniref:protein kinase domain-containing protein n=1 Tax=Nonomuraea sp. CA-218870 TaxID=3239998 RepID=UPI003D8B058D